MLKKLTVAGAAVAAASGALFLATPANAGVDTDGRGGVLSGNQVIVPISIPVDVCGNAIAVIGVSQAGCRGGASVGSGMYHPGYHHPWGS